MDPISIAILGISASSAIAGLIGSQEAAAQKRRETREAVRRLQLQQARTVGQAQAAGAASGVEYQSASTQTYLTTMTAEFKREADWMANAGAAQASAISQSGGYNFVSDIGSAIHTFGAENNWFRKPTIS